MSIELYRTHTEAPRRGTLWENPDNGRLYKTTKVKNHGAVLVVYGTAATTIGALADLGDALRNLGHALDNGLDNWPSRLFGKRTT